MANLTNQQIKDSYQSLITTSETTSDPTTGTLQNGKGTPMTALTLGGALTATSFSGLASGLTNIRLPIMRVEWNLNYANLVNGGWNNMPFDTTAINSAGAYSSPVFTLENSGTSDASVRINQSGIYAIITEAHFYDLNNNIDIRVGFYYSTTSATTGFAFERATSDYKSDEASADQIVTGIALYNFSTAPTWVQMRVNPSINAPYPSNTDNAPPAMTLIRIGSF